MTPHIEAEKEEIAEIVIMPGDPLRAKFITETYLDNYKLVNKVRGMYAYTGYYKNKKVTIMASGMGIPSMGIYSYELFKFYDVKSIIRIGTAGAYTKDLKLYDILLVEESYSDSNYALSQSGDKNNIQLSSKKINDLIIETAKTKHEKIIPSKVYCTDIFYKENDNYEEIYKNHNCIACEMESYSLFHNAKILNRNAACLLTISDSLVTKEETSSEERQTSLKSMIEIALETITKL